MLAAALALPGCGDTYFDTSATSRSVHGGHDARRQSARTRRSPTCSTQLDGLMRRLDEQIVEDEGDDAALARIEESVDVAEQQIRDRDPDDLYPFQQAITLARSGVERRRPADASKGYKLLVAAIDAYDTPA